MDFVEVNGAALRYQMTGSGERALVLVHEMGGTLESWDAVLPRLSSGRRVLRYDTRGAGLSEKARGTLSLDTMVGDLVALMDTAGIPGKAALAGCAVGGAIALACAARAPQRVSAVVVNSPAVGISADRRADVLARVDRMEQEGLRAVVETSLASAYPPEMRRDESAFAAFRARWLGSDPASFAAVYRMLATMDMADALARIACPVLVIAGTFDRTRPPAMVEPVARAIPAARYVVLETAHYAAVQTPDLYAATVNDFLNSVGA
jgi:3-oxoadipate enol-lactonase